MSPEKKDESGKVSEKIDQVEREGESRNRENRTATTISELRKKLRQINESLTRPIAAPPSNISDPEENGTDNPDPEPDPEHSPNPEPEHSPNPDPEPDPEPTANPESASTSNSNQQPENNSTSASDSEDTKSDENQKESLINKIKASKITWAAVPTIVFATLSALYFTYKDEEMNEQECNASIAEAEKDEEGLIIIPDSTIVCAEKEEIMPKEDYKAICQRDINRATGDMLTPQVCQEQCNQQISEILEGMITTASCNQKQSKIKEDCITAKECDAECNMRTLQMISIGECNQRIEDTSIGKKSDYRLRFTGQGEGKASKYKCLDCPSVGDYEITRNDDEKLILVLEGTRQVAFCQEPGSLEKDEEKFVTCSEEE